MNLKVKDFHDAQQTISGPSQRVFWLLAGKNLVILDTYSAFLLASSDRQFG